MEYKFFVLRLLAIRLAAMAILSIGLCLSPCPATAAVASAEPSRQAIWVLDVQAGIGPAIADWLSRSLEDAAAQDVALFVIRLDTPGGLDKSTRTINKAILASPLPVAVFVHPRGARAASAGTYMLYAAHIAAMAPATSLGAATPVGMGMPGSPGQQPPKQSGSQDSSDGSSDSASTDTDDEKQASERPSETKEKPAGKPVPLPSGSAMERKVVNDAVAYIRGLAVLRKRNADWAEDAVRQAVSLDASAALERNVVDYIASDTDDLIAQLQGKSLQMNDNTLLLQLIPYQLSHVEADWRMQLLTLITDPSVAYILLLVGIYGLIFEFYNPGLGGPGIIGAISLLTGMYALQLLPISYIGLALLILGIGLMLAEALSPSIGVLGVGGVASFIIGSVMLMDTDLPGFQVAFPVIASMAVVSAGILILLLRMALRSRHQPVVSGASALLGSKAEVLEDFSTSGQVRVAGEIWQANSPCPLRKGDMVVVTAVKGLTLTVEDKA